ICTCCQLPFRDSTIHVSIFNPAEVAALDRSIAAWWLHDSHSACDVAALENAAENSRGGRSCSQHSILPSCLTQSRASYNRQVVGCNCVGRRCSIRQSTGTEGGLSALGGSAGSGATKARSSNHRPRQLGISCLVLAATTAIRSGHACYRA